MSQEKQTVVPESISLNRTISGEYRSRFHICTRADNKQRQANIFYCLNLIF